MSKTMGTARWAASLALAGVLACSLVPTGARAFAEEPAADVAALGASAASKGEIAGDCLSELAPALGKALSACGVPGAGAIGEVVGLAGGIAAGTLGTLAVESVEDISEETRELCREIDAKCDEILVELDEVESRIEQSAADLERSIAQVGASIDRTNLSNVLAGSDGFQSTYASVTNEYLALAKAVQSYVRKVQDGSLEQADVDAVRVSYEAVERFYDDASSSGSATSVRFNFATDLNNQLARLSPYPAAQAVPDDGNVNDPSRWGARTSVTNTLLECVYAYANDGLAFQHQVGAALQAGVDRAAASLFDYLTAYQLYVSLEVQRMNADPTMSEDDRRVRAIEAWQGYDQAVLKVYRGINQMWSLYKDELTTFMRSYDVEQVVGMDYQAQEQHVYRDENGKDRWYTQPAIMSGETMPAYVVGTTSGELYMIRQKVTDDYTVRDLVQPMFPSEFLYYPSQDFHNLGASTSPSGFSMVDGAADLAGLYGSKAWALAGGSLMGYLTGQGGLDAAKLPVSGTAAPGGKGPFLAMDTYDDYPIVDGNQATSYFGWLDVSKPLSASSAPVVKLDIRKDIVGNPDVAEQPVMTMLAASERMQTSWSTTFGSGGQAKLCAVSYDASNAASFSVLATAGGASGSQKAGSALAVKVRPDAGKAVSSVQLTKPDGTVLTTLFSAEEAGEAYVASLPVDAEGFCTFYFPQAYQNFQVSVSFAPAALPAAHEVRLGTGSKEGALQTTNMDGRSSLEASAGEEVRVYARAFAGKVVDAVRVTAADGSPVEVAAQGADAIVPTPGTRAFTFTMPDQDVAVEAAYRDGVVAALSPVANGKARFVMPTCLNEAWLYQPVTFERGDAVTLAFEPEANYYCSNVTARPASGEALELVPNGATTSFVMPGSDVVVNASFSELGTSPLATISSTGGGQLRFDADGGPAVNVGQRAYRPGSVVKVLVMPDDGYLPVVKVTDYYGAEVQSEFVDGVLTFAMPGSNASVSAEFVEARQVAFDSRGGAPVPAQVVAHLGKLKRPADPAHEGFTFGGWFLDRRYVGDPYDFDRPVESHFTLYAKWIPVEGSAVQEESGQGGPAEAGAKPTPLARTADPLAPLAGAAACALACACAAIGACALRMRWRSSTRR